MCCERPKETRQTRGERKNHTCHSDTDGEDTEADVDDSMEITISLLGAVAEKMLGQVH